MTLRPNQLRFVENDTLPGLRCIITQDDGTPIDITGFTIKVNIGYSTPLVKNASIVDGTNGVWEVSWIVGDLKAGTWFYEIQVTDTSSGIRTWSRDSVSGLPLQMLIDEEIA